MNIGIFVQRAYTQFGTVDQSIGRMERGMLNGQTGSIHLRWQHVFRSILIILT